ncbi:UTP--glucose-1-phosphate uridylyltransferase [subsurface metagenome]
MDAIILAGGKGTRLAPYTTIFPKPLMPIGDVPILDVVLRQLKGHGFTKVIMAVGYLAKLLETYFGKGSNFWRLILGREANTESIFNIRTKVNHWEPRDLFL